MTVSMSRFQKYIVCGVFDIPYRWFVLKCGPKGPKPPNSPFGTYLGTNHQYGRSNTPQTIYFWNLLIETVILSYKTLKSNNFEKMTYNANLQFSNGWWGVKIQFWGPKYFFMVFRFISYGKISDWLNISNKV